MWNIKQNLKQWLGIILIGSIMLLFSVYCLIQSPKDYSSTERRKLAKLPDLTIGNLIREGISDEFEKFSMDQFPLREGFRRLKSLTQYYLFAQKDNHGIYLEDGYVAKLTYPLNSDSVNYALERFFWIYTNYLEGKDINVFSAVVPDKSYFLAGKNGYPVMNYDELFHTVKDGMPYARFIDIAGKLTISDYYRTDTHWRQEKLLSVAELIAKNIGFTIKPSTNYQELSINTPFFGVYYGQLALPLKSDEINILTNELLEQCTVYNYETNQTTKIYDMEKLKSVDAYEIFLSGAAPLIQINNPNANTDKELILFRDSYGSSLAPLLVEGYKTITLVDIRYIKSDLLSEYITFQNQDVLFLYSTLVLNNSYSLK